MDVCKSGATRNYLGKAGLTFVCRSTIRLRLGGACRKKRNTQKEVGVRARKGCAGKLNPFSKAFLLKAEMFCHKKAQPEEQHQHFIGEEPPQRQ